MQVVGKCRNLTSSSFQMLPLRVYLTISSLLCSSVRAADILVFLPYATWSHYMQYELLYETLAARGHHITMYSPYPPKLNMSNFSHVHITCQVFLDIMSVYLVFSSNQRVLKDYHLKIGKIKIEYIPTFPRFGICIAYNYNQKWEYLLSN